MATQYTPILQLALPVTGELNGTWGEVVNDNITSMVEQAIAGMATISTWTANAHTLTTADGTTDEARCAMLLLQTGAGGTALSGAGQVICPALTKLYVVKNDAAYAVTVKTSAGSGISVSAGDTAFVFCDGTNVVAAVTQITNGHITGNLTVDGNATVNGNTTLGNATSDTITATARIASDLNPSADNTYDLGTSGNSWRNLFVDGTATIASLVATTADINGGTVDNATIGATTASTGRFTQVNVTGQGDLRLEDTTGGEYVAIQAPGTLSASYTLTLPVDDGTSGQVLTTDGTGVLSWSTDAGGDVDGPASATDNAVARFDGTTGKLIQNSAVTIADDGATVIAANSTSDGLRITQIGTGNALLVEDSANPDSTPFVINTVGDVVVAYTSTIATTSGVGGANQPKIQLHRSDLSIPSFGSYDWSSNGGISPNLILSKSLSGTIGTRGSVSNGNVLGQIVFNGDDGTNFIRGAQIDAAVDGTPGTNDMPGRLVFSTTADGASSPTERMRIDNAGRVGIGGTPVAGINFYNIKSITGSIVSYQNFFGGTVQSDVTSIASYNLTYPSTAAAAFTLTTLRHYSTDQGTIGAGSTVTNQYGFFANSSLTGATNNYGFYSNIASGTGRWNFYAAGTAANYFAGSVLFGTTTARVFDSASATFTPTVQQEGTDAGTSSLSLTRNSASASGSILAFGKSRSASNGGVTVVQSDDNLGGILFEGTDGTNLIEAAAIQAAVDGTPGTNDMPGRLVFSTTADGASSPTERMRIDSAGRVGIGGTPTAGQSVTLNANMTGNTTSVGFRNAQTIQSDVTASAWGFNTAIATQATTFTLTNLAHYRANQGTIGAGSTVTNQFGFQAESTLTGATNNYGFYSNIASGTGRYNFYAAGSADNFMAGRLGIGVTTPAMPLDVVADSSANAFRVRGRVADNYAKIQFTTNGGGSELGFIINDGASNLLFGTGTSERMRIDSSGNVAIGGGTTAGTTLALYKPITGATSSFGATVSTVISSDVTARVDAFSTFLQTQAAAFTLTDLNHFAAGQGTIGAGSAVTSQFGFRCRASLTGATNNYGFYSDIASGTGRWNFYAAGTANNYFAGRLGLATTTLTSINLRVSNTITGGTSANSVVAEGSVQSDVTSDAAYFVAYAQTAASAFTTTNIRQFYARQGTLGAGSAVTNQYGFATENSLTGATNNYGFYSNIASGAGRWNFYAAGTADNYFAGNVNIGQTVGTNKLTVGQGSAGTAAAFIYNGSTGGGAEIRVSNGYSSTVPVYGFWYNNDTGVGNPAAQTFSVITAATERMRIDSSGNVIHTAPTTAPTLSTNGTMVFNLTSNTNLRVSVRGSDGVTRTANITLA